MGRAKKVAAVIGLEKIQSAKRGGHILYTGRSLVNALVSITARTYPTVWTKKNSRANSTEIQNYVHGGRNHFARAVDTI